MANSHRKRYTVTHRQDWYEKFLQKVRRRWFLHGFRIGRNFPRMTVTDAEDVFKSLTTPLGEKRS